MPVTNNIQANAANGGQYTVTKDRASNLQTKINLLNNEGFDTTVLKYCRDNKILLDGKQANNIQFAIQDGVSNEQIMNFMLNPLLPADKMLEVRHCIRAGINLEGFKLDQMTPQQIHEEFASKVIPEGTFHANSIMSRENTCMFEVYPSDNSKINFLNCVVLDSTRQQPISAVNLVEWSKPVSSEIISSVKNELDRKGYLSKNLEKCEDGCSLYNTVKSLTKSDVKVCEILDKAGVMGIEYSLDSKAYTMPMPSLTVNFKNSPDVLTADYFLQRDKTQVIDAAMNFAHEFGTSDMCVNLVTSDNVKMNDFLELERRNNAPITSMACDNELWICVSRCTESDIAGIYLKEVGVKMGFEELVGKDIAGEFLNTVWDTAQNNWTQNNNLPTIKNIVGNINKQHPDYSQEEKGLEFIKAFAQTTQVQDKLNKQEKGLWVKLKNAVKKLIGRRFKVDVSQAMSEKALTKVIVESCKVGLEMRSKTKLNLVVTENQKQQISEAHIQHNKQEKRQKKGMKV